MAVDSSTLADEFIASPHRSGTEHRLNIELANHPLSSKGSVETEEPAPAVRTHAEESTPAMAENVDATSMSKFETEFRNLLAFRNLPVTKANLCRVALEDWQSSAQVMGKRVEKRQKEIRSIRNEIYQVVGFYSAFQGLLLTAIAQSNLLHWNNRGYPLALSAFATGIAATGVVQKNTIIRAWKNTLASENPARKGLIRRVNKLRTEGIKFQFQDVYDDECKEKKPETTLNMLFSLLFTYDSLVVATLITFGVLCVASMLQILRHPGIPAQ